MFRESGRYAARLVRSNRSRTALSAAIGLLAVLAALALAPGAQARSSYCSPTGDFCQLIYKKNGTRYLEMRAFGDYGVNEVCVAHTTNVCHSTRLRERSNGIFVSRVNWNRRFPRQGKGRYRVRGLADGDRIGAVLTFKR